jgi:hypothetical protein
MAGGEDCQSGSAEEVSLVESRIDEKHLMQTGWFFSDRLVKLMERVAGNSKGLGPGNQAWKCRKSSCEKQPSFESPSPSFTGKMDESVSTGKG